MSNEKVLYRSSSDGEFDFPHAIKLIVSIIKKLPAMDEAMTTEVMQQLTIQTGSNSHTIKTKLRGNNVETDGVI